MLIERLLRHMSWANQALYASVVNLPDEALGAYLVKSEFTAGEILRHIVAGSTWYNYCLGIEHWREIKAPTNMDDVRKLAVTLKELDQQIIDAASMEDKLVMFQGDNGDVTVLTSTLFSQAVHHATEHRAQLVDALEFHGHKVISLDDLDLWSFEHFEKNN